MPWADFPVLHRRQAFLTQWLDLSQGKCHPISFLDFQVVYEDQRGNRDATTVLFVREQGQGKLHVPLSFCSTPLAVVFGLVEKVEGHHTGLNFALAINFQNSPHWM